MSKKKIHKIWRYLDLAKLMTWGDSHWGAVQLQSNSKLPGRHSKAHFSHKDWEKRTSIRPLFFLGILTHIVLWLHSVYIENIVHIVHIVFTWVHLGVLGFTWVNLCWSGRLFISGVDFGNGTDRKTDKYANRGYPQCIEILLDLISTLPLPILQTRAKPGAAQQTLW